MTGKEVEPTQDNSVVPAHSYGGNFEFDAKDIKLPKLKLGQKSSRGVEVPFGCVYTTMGQDDPEPQVLYKLGDKDGVVFHVVGRRKGMSWTEGGELRSTFYNDPEAPPEAWVTYTYTVFIKGEESLPFDWLLTRSASQAAKQINLILMQHQVRGLGHEVAFELSTKEKENDKGKWVVPQVRVVEADPADIEAAASFARFMGPQPVEPTQKLAVPEL